MSVATKMTAIADKIRNLSGVTGALTLDDMVNNLGSVETETVEIQGGLGEQDSLLTELATVLAGKAAGGGSVLKTCVVSACSWGMNAEVIYTTVENGVTVSKNESLIGEDYIELAVMKGSTLTIVCREASGCSAYGTGGVTGISTGLYHTIFVFSVQSDGTAEIGF